MSYDIYGNPLRRGHCEVHPHVHETYPCSVCIETKRQHDADEREAAEHYGRLHREWVDSYTKGDDR